jgi:5-methylcytosine-specific restriction endonuclease McrA
MKRNYNDEEYAKFRKEVLARDKRKCQMPNCKNKTNLQVHHVKKWSKAHSLRYDIKNGITLCKRCHRSISGKEHHYEPLFIEIINRNA